MYSLIQTQPADFPLQCLFLSLLAGLDFCCFFLTRSYSRCLSVQLHVFSVQQSKMKGKPKFTAMEQNFNVGPLLPECSILTH